MRTLPRQHNADFGREIARILPLTDIDDRNVRIGNLPAVSYSFCYNYIKTAPRIGLTCQEKVIDLHISLLRGL